MLRGQEALFGAVASETPAHRVVKSIDAEELILDLDASLLTAHSEKESAAGTYKGG